MKVHRRRVRFGDDEPTGHRIQQKRRIVDRAGDRACDVQCHGACERARDIDSSVGRPDTYHATDTRGEADRAAGIRADTAQGQSRSDRRRRAARRPAR